MPPPCGTEQLVDERFLKGTMKIVLAKCNNSPGKKENSIPSDGQGRQLPTLTSGLSLVGNGGKNGDRRQTRKRIEIKGRGRFTPCEGDTDEEMENGGGDRLRTRQQPTNCMSTGKTCGASGGWEREESKKGKGQRSCSPFYTEIVQYCLNKDPSLHRLFLFRPTLKNAMPS